MHALEITLRRRFSWTLRRILAGGAFAAGLMTASCLHSGIIVHPPPVPVCVTATSQSGLIVQFRDAYQRRDYDCFSNLFSTAADSAPYSYFLDEPAGATWDLVEELRIHRRMFHPEDPLPDEDRVPPELWLAAIAILLDPWTDWTERWDLYRSDTNPGGLDPNRWRATEAQFHAYLYFDMMGETDYVVNGLCAFVVLEDLRKKPGLDRKFLIDQWKDLGPIVTAAIAGQPASWSVLKAMYR
jgi:hypothetical protein